MILKNQVHHIKAERDILTESENPWIVTLYSSFQVRLGASSGYAYRLLKPFNTIAFIVFSFDCST